MSAAAVPPDEERRLEVLHGYEILDTVAEPSFDRITDLVVRVLGTPIALISLVDAERQWFKSCAGFDDARQTGRDVAFCAHAILANDVFVVEDATQDPRFAANPMVVGPPHVRAYAGAPLVSPEGLRVGTLCALDRRPRAFSGAELATLVDLAAVVVSELELRRGARALAIAEERAARSEHELAGRVEVLEAILETAGEGILVADEEAQIIVANPFVRELLGRGPSDSLPRDPAWPRDHGMFKEDGATQFELADFPLERALRGERVDNVAMYLENETYPDGMHVQLTGRPVYDSRGNVRGGVVTMANVTELKRAERRLAELAVTDELTRLPNRRALRERLELLAAEAARGRRFSVAIADIDHFKKVNDTHGHAVGDQVLVAVAGVLRDAVRRSDLVARLGGEEFCVVQTDVDVALMAMLTERLRAAVAALREPLAVTASFGVCHSTTTREPAALLALADQALYRAKDAGRNRVEIA